MAVMNVLPWVYSDGGRAAAGLRGSAGDCVTRAIAIATELPYRRVYDELNEQAESERVTQGHRRSSARSGVRRPVYETYLRHFGAVWTPTMAIGAGCQVHLAAGELPSQGRLVVALSRHVCAVVDGVVYDTSDPGRGGTRCVYGFYTMSL